MPDDFDGEGSPAYKRETIDRAIELIPKMEDIARKAGFYLGSDSPAINPADRGSIDVWWHSGEDEVLMNITPELQAYYYGSSRDGSEILGEIPYD